MILPLIRELNQVCRTPKLNKAQRDRAYNLMSRLREYGFTNHELFKIVRGRIPEASIKRNTRGVEVRDTVEHDQIIESLSDFAERGYEVRDIEEYKESKAILDKAGLTFDSITKLSLNLLYIGVDVKGLLDLSDELKRRELKAKAIRENIDFNEELKQKGINVEIQKEIRDAAKNYGDPVTILRAVNAAGGIQKLASELYRLNEDVSQAKIEKDQARVEKERLEAETIIYKSYIDIVKLLVTKYSFDISSLGELLSLAKKHGNPPQVIRAVNVYDNIVELQVKQREAQIKLDTLEENLANIETTLKVREESLAKANQLLGEIKANQAQSLRLQIVSDLIMKPKEAKAPVNELARICLIILMGVKEYTEYHKQDSDRFRDKVGMRLDWMIQALNEYLR